MRIENVISILKTFLIQDTYQVPVTYDFLSTEQARMLIMLGTLINFAA